ncbi:MAG: GNAT family N-acetyltransferase [Rhodopila sp.]
MTASAGSVVIRPYQDEDSAAVIELFIRVNRALAPEGMEEAFESYIALALTQEISRIPDYYGGPDRGFWVAVDAAGRLLGTYGLEPAPPDALELRRMYVAPEARRRGIARTMLQHAERSCVALGHRKLVLSTASIQTAALALYRVAGYRLVREETARAASNKTVGGGIARLHFEKMLNA